MLHQVGTGVSLVRLFWLHAALDKAALKVSSKSIQNQLTVWSGGCVDTLAFT